MFKLFLAPLLAISLFPSCASLRDRTPSVVDRVSGSVVRITSVGEAAVCTGFVIGHEQVLTDAHCLFDDIPMTADSKNFTVIRKEPFYDLALIHVPGLNKPNLNLRVDPVHRFEEIIGIGYAWGWRKLTVLKNIAFLVDFPLNARPGILAQGGYIGGMSGGPVIDLEGNVIGIIQKSNEHVGYSVGVILIRAFLLGIDGVGVATVDTIEMRTVPFLRDHE